MAYTGETGEYMVIQKLLYKSLSLENYLRILQKGYFLAYHLGLLKLSSKYTYHYFIKKLINKGDTIIDIGANLGYYSILFAQWTGRAGKVYAVEPVKIFNKILRVLTKDRYKCVQVFIKSIVFVYMPTHF